MGGCTSSPEKPKQNSGSVAYTQKQQQQQQAAHPQHNSGPVSQSRAVNMPHGGGGGGGGGYPGGSATHMMQPMAGSISGPMQGNPFQRGMPGMGMGGPMGGGGRGGGTLTYIALYDYDARTHEDLTFRKGTNLNVCVCVCVYVSVHIMCIVSV